MMQTTGTSRWRWGLIPIGILLIYGALLGLLWSVEGWDRGWRWVGTYLLSLVTFGLMVAWVALLAPWSKLWKILVLCDMLLAVVVVCVVFELEGFDGDLGPVIRLRRWGGEPAGPPDQRELSPAKPLIITSSQADSPGFLGSQRTASVPLRLDPQGWNTRQMQPLWSVPLGKGWSSFAVVGGYAFTQEMLGTREYVTCLELNTGKLVWRRAESESGQGFLSRIAGDGPRATPTVAQGKVYTLGSTGTLACFDAATGKRLWSRNVLAPYGAVPPNWGCASSPLVVQGLVIVAGGGGRSPALMAFHTQDGSPAWQAGPEGGASDCYDSPMLATLCGIDQVLHVNNQEVAGYDPRTGRKLWSHPWPWPGAEHPKVAQPLVVGPNQLVIAAGYDSGVALLKLSKGKQGELRAQLVWKNRNLKPKFTNLVLHQGHLFGLDMGILACVELRTGRRKWKRGRFGHGQVLLLGDVLLIQAEAGHLALVAADPGGYRLLGQVPALEDKTWNVPVVAQGLLLVRNDRQGMCFRLPQAKQGSESGNHLPSGSPPAS